MVVYLLHVSKRIIREGLLVLDECGEIFQRSC